MVMMRSAIIPEPRAHETLSAPRSRYSRRVLVIDDIPEVVAALRYVLEEDGHTVDVAYDGEEAVCIALRTHPDVILSDIGLPGRADGYVVAEMLRASGLFDSTLMVAITGATMPEDVERSTSAGFDLHIPKPADAHAIVKLIAELRDEDA
jgi:CheY-like chemotaxis protein